MSAHHHRADVSGDLTAWHYGDPLREQRWMDEGSAVVEIPRDVVVITGKDRLSLLNALGTQKLDGLSVGESTSTYLLDPQGHVSHFLSLVTSEDAVWGSTEAGYGQGLVDHLNHMKFRMDVVAQVQPEIGVFWCGSQVERGSRLARGGTPNCLEGYEVFSSIQEVPPQGNKAGLWAYTARRIAAGVPRFGSETDDRSLPNELGVPSEAVSLNKGCYPGQETVARIHNVGAPPRRLVRLHLDGSQERFLDDPKVVPIALAEDPATSIGFLGSVGYHHELGLIGLGLVKRQTDDTAELVIDGGPARMEPLVSRDVGLHVTADLTPLARRRLM